MRSSVLLTTGSGRLRAAPLRLAIAALAAIGLLAVIAGAPSSAQADFTLQQCQGSAVQGEGSSLQKTAQLSFWDSAQVYLSENSLADGCGPSAPQVTFHSASSGCGLDAIGAGGSASECSYSSKEPSPPAGYRDETDRFGASDFAPDPEEETAINDGPAGGTSVGQIHVIPVAGAAITAIVHFPEGCELENPIPVSGTGSANDNTTTGGVNDPTGAATGDSFAEGTLRVHIPAKALEEIWEHKITTWGEIPTPAGGGSTLGEFMTGTPTGQDTGDECKTAPIFRIVRLDTSGTSYNFKAYLSLLPSFSEDGGVKLWKEGQVGSTNTAWPLASAGDPGTPPAAEPTEIAKVPNPNANQCNLTISPDQICHAAASGGGGLTNAVNATDGSIGYVDLATAREKGFTIEPKKADHSYWIPLEPVNPATTPGTIDTGVFREPTTDPTAHFNPALNTSIRGANCSGADWRGYPTGEADATLGDWSKAIATGGTTYPVCAITYDLAFDDNATVYGNTPKEEAEARTVKDYLTSVTSDLGQLELAKFDYATLPATLITDAQTGVAAIGWNKSSGSGGSKEETVAPPSKTSTSSVGVTPITTVVTPPSNAFSIASAKVKGRDVVLSLVLPDAGKVQIKAAGGGVTVSSVSASVSGGQGTVTLPISSAALKKLAKEKSKKLSVTITVTFTPTGGAAATQTKSLTITQASVATKKPKKTTKKHKKK
jgi:ABC-type phosphate transport system substrate-binding protein